VTLLKKNWMKVLLVFVGIAVGISGTLAVFYFGDGDLYYKVYGRSAPSDKAAIGSTASNAELTAYAFEILGYMKENDFEALSGAVHPDYGVVFSPYATISLASNKCFTANKVAGFAKDDNHYVWGKYDGSDNPIDLTPAEYFKEFVFDRDFTQAPEIGVDTIIMSGNSLENFTDVFPDARFVDFHIPSSDSDAEGLDWTSLRLGFEEYKGQLKLTVVVHSEWTV
jgi:hypothetical protein